MDEGAQISSAALTDMMVLNWIKVTANAGNTPKDEKGLSLILNVLDELTSALETLETPVAPEPLLTNRILDLVFAVGKYLKTYSKQLPSADDTSMRGRFAHCCKLIMVRFRISALKAIADRVLSLTTPSLERTITSALLAVTSVETDKNLCGDYITSLTMVIISICGQFQVRRQDYEDDDSDARKSKTATHKAQVKVALSDLSLLMKLLRSACSTESSGTPDLQCPGSVVKALPDIFAFLGPHTLVHAWTDSELRATAKGLIDLTIVLAGSSVTPEGRSEAISSCFAKIITKLRWEESELAKYGLYWAVLSLKRPDAGDKVGTVLPLLLRLLDHFKTPPRVLGVEAVHHLANEVPAAELRRNGIADVLFDGLFKLMYVHEAELAEPLLPCISKMLQTLQWNPSATSTELYDKVMRKLLTDMFLETRMHLRHAYLKGLKELVKVMEVSVVGHFKKLMEVLVDYLKTRDEFTAKLTVAVVLEVVKVGWIRIQAHAARLIKSLKDCQETNKSCSVEVSECVTAISHCGQFEADETISRFVLDCQSTTKPSES